MRIANYEVGKQIAEGGAARVYEATHIYLNRMACIKQNIHADPFYVDLFRAEAELMWLLDDHHSIPSIKDFVPIDQNNAAIIMNHIAGKTLEDIVAKGQRLHPEDACWVAERLLEALYYCHCNGVIHSDVKPGNVFVEPDKRDIKLIDFGMATLKPTSTSRPIGYTPIYAAPELQAGMPPIPESDIYGAGMVMLCALSGNPAANKVPDDTPEPIVKYLSTLLRHNPVERPRWDRDNPIEALSDLRLEVFGRRHMH